MDNKEIIKLLIENKDKDFTILQISKILRKNYRMVYESINALTSSETIVVNKIGNTKISKLHKVTNELILSELERKDEALSNINIKLIYNQISKINEQFIVVLFGSYAKKKQTKNSDIDLLVISDKDKISKHLELLDLNIHITHVSYREFEKLLTTTKFNVVKEVQINNIILFGVEEYYRILENVKRGKN